MINQLPDRIKQHILGQVNRMYKRNEDRIWVTDILYCLRKAYFRFRDPKPISLEDAWRIWLGTVIHKELEGLYPGQERKWELGIYNTGAVLVGKYDFMDNNMIYEIKAVGDNYVHYLKKSGPSEEYILQLQLYMYNKGIEDGALLYVMHDGPLMEHVSLKDFDIHSMLRRALLLVDALRTNTPPKKTDRTFQCKKCEYKDECKGVKE